MLGVALHLWLWLANTSPELLAYETRVTAGVDPGQPMPTVVVLHGRDEALHGLHKALARGRAPIRVIVPRGPRRGRGGKHAWFRPREAHTKAARSEEIAGAAAQVIALLEALQASGTVEGRPVLVGYSQGAVVALEVSLRAPGAVAEVFALAGHLPPGHVPTEFAEHAVTHVLGGDADRVMRWPVTRAQVAEMQALGFSVEASAFQGQGHGVGKPMRLAAVRGVRSALEAQRARHASL